MTQDTKPAPIIIDWKAPKGASVMDFTGWLHEHLKARVQIRRDKDGEIDVTRQWMRSHSLAIDITDADEVAHRGTFWVPLPCRTAKGDEDVEDIAVNYELQMCAQLVAGRWIERYEVEVVI